MYAQFKSRISKIFVQLKLPFFFSSAHSGLGILGDSAFEKVGLALQANRFHPLKGTLLDFVNFRESQFDEKAIGNLAYVVLHGRRIHANKSNGQSITDKGALGIDALLHNLAYAILSRSLFGSQFAKETAGKIPMETFVASNELIGLAKTIHKEASLFHVKDARKGTAKGDAFDACKGNESFAKARMLARGPLESPVGLGLDARKLLNSTKELLLLVCVANKRVDELAVDFALASHDAVKGSRVQFRFVEAIGWRNPIKIRYFDNFNEF
jgi:hypothetical protein